ncbi:hypothetical protein E4T56_gene8936, partial [Termitomyces sp. T112]
MHHRPVIGRIDAQRGVNLRGGHPADEQRDRHPRALHFLGPGHHFVERRRDQAGQADDIDLFLLRRLDDPAPRHHHAQVDHLIAVALQDHAHDVLADVVNVALDGGHDDPALGLGAFFLGRLDKGDGEHLARSEQVAHAVHARHQRTFDHLDRAGVEQAGLFGVLDDMGVDALDQRMFEAFHHIIGAPFLGLLFRRLVLALETFGQSDQPL